jgi:uncharacterized protein (TIGR03437 family)
MLSEACSLGYLDFIHVFHMTEKMLIDKGLLIILFALAWSYSVSPIDAQTLSGSRPDVVRALAQRVTPRTAQSTAPRKNGYTPVRALAGNRPPAVPGKGMGRRTPARLSRVRIAGTIPEVTPSAGPITLGTSLARVLHTSQLSLTTIAGSDEQYFDSNFDLVADQRRTFDSDGGSFDIAIGKSGTRYEVFSATDTQGKSKGILVSANDTNGDFIRDTSASFDLYRDFGLPSAVAVVSGTSTSGREFIIVSSSGYFNPNNPNDPNNEPSAGVVLLVRAVGGSGFDSSLSRSLVQVGDNKLNNANALTMLPGNNLLIADFDSHELRIVRDTNNDGIPDTLDTKPFYTYKFSDDGPLDVAANSRGVVFSHGYGNNTVLLAIYDDNADGYGETEETAVQGLSIDNNLVFHGLAVDREGTAYLIEDASGAADSTADGGNLGTPQIDAFPDPALNGILRDGAAFASVDQPAQQGLSGLGFGSDQLLGPVGRVKVTNSATFTGNATFDGLATITGTNLTGGATGMTEANAAQSGVFVTVEGRNARVLSFNDTQINIYIPNAVGAGTRSVLVFKNSDIVAADDVTITDANPGVFTPTQTGSGQALSLLASGLRYTAGPFDAVTDGQPSVVVVYGTGWRNALPLTVTIGGKPATVQYAGTAGDFPGLDEAVVVIPTGVTGNANIVITTTNAKSSRSDVFLPLK